MTATDSYITREQKEASAITVMRCMLITYAEEKQLSFEEAMLAFAGSKTYGDLFDFDTEIWKEGPTYLRSLYDEELS